MELVVILTLFSFPGCTLDSIAAQQERATGLWDELVGGETFGQSFVSARDNLYRIDLSTATYARTNSAPVILHLQSNPEATTDIISVTLPGPEIQNERPTSILFPPLPNSQGRSLFFYIESPEGMPGEAITVYANGHDQYTDGGAYRNGQAVAGDLVFTAYSRETFAFTIVLRDFFSRAGQDVPFFVCYAILISVIAAGLLACLFKHLRPRLSTGAD